MGSCESSSDNIEAPKMIPSSIIAERKQLASSKHVFDIPKELEGELEVHTAVGKITDYITKNAVELNFIYETFDVKSSLDKQDKFEDKVFKATAQSLGSQPYPEQIEWQRASTFFKNEYFVFQGKIQPTDIKQGRLGDCYLLSAIASLSEYPFIIKRIFETKTVSQLGYYGIWLFIDGLWQCIVLDDYFPMHAGRPFFSRNSSNELWVMLIEKAYAKIFRSYQAIESGLAGIALNNLTAAPYEYLNKDSKTPIDADTAWNFLTTHFAQNHLLVGSTENDDRNEHMGLVSSHAYSILDVQEVTIATKKGKKKERILKLQNPWAKYQWKGRWSDYSDVWTEELRQQLKFQQADDGLFWICIEDFLENFGQICVCKYNKNYISTSLKLVFPDNDNAYKGVFLRTSNRSQGYLSLIQKDHRHFNKNYEYSLARAIVLRLNKTTGQLTEYINDMIDCDRDATLRLQLDPGLYYIIIEMDWKCNFTRDVVLQFYGQQPVALFQDKSINVVQGLFNQVVMLHKRITEQQRIYNYAKDQKISRTTGSIAGYVYYYYLNKSVSNNYLCETVSLKQRKNIEVYKDKLPDQFTVKVFPSEERIMWLKVKKQGNSFYSFVTKIQFFLVEKYSLEKLRQLADKKPVKVKKRQIEGKEIDVRIKTYNYSGGIALLYQNKMDKYAYVQVITFQLDNLELQNQTMSSNMKLQIELEPQTEKLLSFVLCSPGKEIAFKTKMSFYINAPEFKF